MLLFFYSETAKNKRYLLDKLKITHLLNCAEGKKFGFCRSDRSYYSDTPIKYLGLPILDVPTQDISQYFRTAADFIEDALNSGGIFLFKNAKTTKINLTF